MNEQSLTPAEAVRSALLRVSGNVAKHIIQRDGWTEDDACFRVDLRAAEAELMAVFDAQAAELERLRNHCSYMEAAVADRDAARVLAGRLAGAVVAFEEWRAIAPGKLVRWKDACETAWRNVIDKSAAALAEARAAGLLK